MKSKKIGIIILVLLMLLIIAGGAFAYAYIATDIFKTDQEMFFKYFSQITAENGFIEKGIVDFEKKKMQTPYKNLGEITINLEDPGELDEKIIEKVKGLVIRFDGKIDSANQKAEQNIEIDYGNNVILPISYKQDGNKFGLQSDKLSKQYIGIRNEKLKEFATKFGIEDLSEIPDKIELSNIEEKAIFTDEEIEQLKQIYGTVLQQELVEENFTRVKTQQNESYTLELSAEQIKNIIIKMLEATKSNTMIIDKINELILEQDTEIEKIDVSVIDDLIKSINEEDISEIPNLRLTIVQSNKQLKQIIIQLAENQILIEKSSIQDTINYDINCEIKEETSDSFSLIEEESKPAKINIYFKLQYIGLETLSNVQEVYQLGFVRSEGDEKLGYDYIINTNTQFDESISISSLDKSNTVFLNDYDATQVTNFLTQVGTKLLEINKKQMTELGLKEYENPILYSNPITMLYIMQIEAMNAIKDSSLEDYEKQQFNQTFTPYEGQMVSGSDVNAMIHIVQNSNLVNEEKSVKVTLDGNEVTENVDSSKIYKVEAVYDIDGYIAEMRVSI